MRYFILVLLFLACVSFLQAQEERPQYKNQLKFTPFRLVDWVNPGIELSYERLTSRRFSSQLSAAYMTDPMQLSYKNYKGVRLGLEEKFFLLTKKVFRPYVASSLVYAFTTFKTVGSFRYPMPGAGFDSLGFRSYPDTFTVKKNALSMNLKFGFQVLAGHFVLDFCVGLGLKYRSVNHYDRIVPGDKMEIPRHPNIYYMSEVEGQGFIPSIPISLKLGYLF